MDRFLTPPELNFVKQALDFFKEFGPSEVVVANYSGSYPNNPEKAVVKWPIEIAGDIKIVLEYGPETYDRMVEAFLLTQPSDIHDWMDMQMALVKGQRHCQDRIIDIVDQILSNEREQ